MRTWVNANPKQSNHGVKPGYAITHNPASVKRTDNWHHPIYSKYVLDVPFFLITFVDLTLYLLSFFSWVVLPGRYVCHDDMSPEANMQRHLSNCLCTKILYSNAKPPLSCSLNIPLCKVYKPTHSIVPFPVYGTWIIHSPWYYPTFLSFIFCFLVSFVVVFVKL